VPTITVDDLQPGMILKSDAVHHNGRVLLRGGITLQDKHIKMFKTWGLVSADIEGVTQEQVESELLNDLPPALIDGIHEDLSWLFRHTDRSQALIGELYRLLVRRRAAEKTRGWCSEVDR
jgi:hypothetical protein